jgi:hypothetical protein
MEPLSGAGEAALFGDGEKGFELAEVHGDGSVVYQFYL